MSQKSNQNRAPIFSISERVNVGILSFSNPEKGLLTREMKIDKRFTPVINQ